MAAGRDDQQHRCLPSSHVLYHTMIRYSVSNRRVLGKQDQKNKCSRNYNQHGIQQQLQYYNKSSSSSSIMNKLHPQDTSLQLPKSSNSRCPTSNRVVRSHRRGMRPIFVLDHGKKPCAGTGVFFPRNVSATSSSPDKSSTICSPVLLPARVVPAFNLNVSELGLRFSRCELDSKNSSKPGNRDTLAAANCTSAVEDSQDENVSPELLLPKEWTY